MLHISFIIVIATSKLGTCPSFATITIVIWENLCHRYCITSKPNARVVDTMTSYYEELHLYYLVLGESILYLILYHFFLSQPRKVVEENMLVLEMNNVQIICSL